MDFSFLTTDTPDFNGGCSHRVVLLSAFGPDVQLLSQLLLFFVFSMYGFEF
jgi:hypothetical protein